MKMSVKTKPAAVAPAPQSVSTPSSSYSSSTSAPKCCHRRQTLEALERSAIHQSLSTPTSRVAMARCRTATLDDPRQAMEVLRSMLQPAINAEIRRAMRRFVEDFFRPAAANARKNAAASAASSGDGDAAAADKLVQEVCGRALDQAKSVFRAGSKGSRPANNHVKSTAAVGKSSGKQVGGIKRKLPLKKLGGTSAAKKKKLDVAIAPATVCFGFTRPNTDLILVSKTGKPVRREGPKWEPKRLNGDTLFILGSKANKALGFGQTRGRLYIKHPELFK